MSPSIVVVRTSHIPRRCSNLSPRASPSLLARRGAPLARRPWKCRRLGAPATPPLARTRASPWLALWIEEPLPPTWEPPPLLRIEEPPPVRRGQGATATAATGRGSTAARALGQPPSSHAPSLMNWDGHEKLNPSTPGLVL
jgi:hypothetical protein